MTSAQRREGRARCRKAGVRRQPFLGDCIVDVGITGKDEFATAANDLATTLVDNAKHAEATAWQALSSVSLDYFADDPTVLSLGGSRALVAWTQRENPGQAPSTYALDSVAFTSSAAAGVSGPQAAQVVSGWSSLDSGPQLWRRTGGDPAIVWAGLRTLDTSDPLTDRTLIATLGSDGTWGAPVVVTRGANSDPAAIAAGSELFVKTTTGSSDLLLYRGIDPEQTPASIDDVNGYAIGPQLARNADGTVWIAWRTPVSNDADGVYVRPLDPLTGQPLGPSQKAPGSEAGGELLEDRAAFACPPSGPCRLAYPSADGKHVVTWAPGEAQPTTIATSDRPRELRIAYDAAGGLWVVFYDDGRFHVIHGDARGAGAAEVVDPPATEPGHTNVLALPGGLLVVANFGDNQRNRSVSATFVSG